MLPSEQRRKSPWQGIGSGIGSGIYNRPSRAAEVPQPVELCCEYSAYMLLYQHQFDIVSLHPDTAHRGVGIKSPQPRGSLGHSQLMVDYSER